MISVFYSQNDDVLCFLSGRRKNSNF